MVTVGSRYRGDVGWSGSSDITFETCLYPVISKHVTILEITESYGSLYYRVEFRICLMDDFCFDDFETVIILGEPSGRAVS
jgi:hypothetical protein